MARREYIEITLTIKQAVAVVVCIVFFAGIALYSAWLDGYTYATKLGTQAIET